MALSGCSSWNVFGSSRTAAAAAPSILASINHVNWIIDGTTRCATTNPYAQEGENIRWYGRCRDGKLDGYGTLIWYRYGMETERNEGMFSDGELHGTVVTTHANGNIIYGEYDKGLRNGLFVVVDDPSSVAFIAAMPSGPSAGGLYRIRLSVENGRLTLLRKAASNTDPGFEFLVGDDRLVLATGVTDLRFRYFANESVVKPANWQSTWTGKKTLPQLIRMTVIDKMGEQWPDLVATLPLGPSPR